MGALCTEFVQLSVGLGEEMERGEEGSQTWGSSLPSEVSTDTFSRSHFRTGELHRY